MTTTTNMTDEEMLVELLKMQNEQLRTVLALVDQMGEVAKALKDMSAPLKPLQSTTRATDTIKVIDYATRFHLGDKRSRAAFNQVRRSKEHGGNK